MSSTPTARPNGFRVTRPLIPRDILYSVLRQYVSDSMTCAQYCVVLSRNVCSRLSIGTQEVGPEVTLVICSKLKLGRRQGW